MGRHARTLVLAFTACLCTAASASAAVPDKGAEVAARDAQAACRVAGGPCQPEASEAAIAEFEGSATHDTLLFQHRLGDDVGMVDAPWAATHNSYNSIAEMGPALSTTDSNQQIGMVEQLRLGIRSLEIDIHKFRQGVPVVCHARGASEGHAGCSVEREVQPTLEPIAAWLRANPGEVVMLSLEDHMGDAAGYDAGAAQVRAAHGDQLYEPGPGGCHELPRTLTRDDVLAAGAQAFVVSDCGPGTGWNQVAFAWGPMHEEGQPDGFDGETCGPQYTRAVYDAQLIRYYEDSTGLSYGVAQMGGGGEPAKLTPEVTAAMVACGVDHIGFDQLVPSDGRLDALAWSWADGVPSSGSCAVQGSDARWRAATCDAKRPVACRDSDGSWSVTRKAVRRDQASRECSRAGAAFAAPRTGYENAQLREAAGDRSVLLGLARTGSSWRPLDTR